MTVSDEGGVKTHDVPLANLESLSLLGGVQISTQAITRLKRKSRRIPPPAFILSALRFPARPPGTANAMPPAAAKCRPVGPGHPARGGHLPSVRCQTISETLVIPCHHLMCSRSGFRDSGATLAAPVYSLFGEPPSPPAGWNYLFGVSLCPKAFLRIHVQGAFATSLSPATLI